MDYETDINAPDTDDNQPERPAIDGEVLKPVPRPGGLANLTKVRKELARVYRDGRQGRIDPNTLSKFAYTLTALGKLVEAETMEARVQELERMIEAQTGQPVLLDGDSP